MAYNNVKVVTVQSTIHQSHHDDYWLLYTITHNSIPSFSMTTGPITVSGIQWLLRLVSTSSCDKCRIWNTITFFSPTEEYFSWLVYYALFKNISVIKCWKVLFWQETRWSWWETQDHLQVTARHSHFQASYQGMTKFMLHQHSLYSCNCCRTGWYNHFFENN